MRITSAAGWRFAVVAGFLGVSGFMTAPLGWRMARVLLYYGSPGDAMFGIVNVWTWTHKQAWLVGHGAGLPGLGLEPILKACLLGLSVLTNEVVAYNLLLWVSFPLAGLTMYLLCWSLTRHRAGSVVAGLAYAFCPYHFAHTTQLSLASIQWLPLVPWSLWRWIERPTRATWLTYLAVTAWTTLWNLHYGVFTLVMLGVAGVGLVRAQRRLWGSWLSVMVFNLALGITVFQFGKQSVIVVPSERLYPLKNLFVYSAKPWDYLLPSLYHPLWGRLVTPFIQRHWYGSNVVEQTLFLGYGLLTLAFLGLLLGRRAGPREARAIWILTAIGLVALVCSGPPYVPLGSFQITHDQILARVKWYFPSFIIYHFLPWGRRLCVYARFGILVMLSACGLAAFGMKALMARIQRPAARWGVAAVAAVAVLTEFLGGAQVREVAHVPPVYEWLVRQPGSEKVVEYPLRKFDTDVHAEYLFWYRVHQKPLFNQDLIGELNHEEELRQELADVSRPGVRRQLAARGVRYVIVHPVWYQRPITTAPERLSIWHVTYAVPNKHAWEPLTPPRLTADAGWQMVGQFDDARVYRVPADG